MIHPINIPEDLLSANPKRPQFFKPPKPKQQIRYAPDGRRLDANGSALEPIAPIHYWNDVFMRAFIRRLMPNETTTATTTPTRTTSANAVEQTKNTKTTFPTHRNAVSLFSHVDIVDLSPSSAHFPSFTSSFVDEEDKTDELPTKNDDERKYSAISVISVESNGTNSSSSRLTPDRPSTEVSPSSTDEEEAEGDGLARIGSSTRMPQRAQRVSKKAIRAMLKPCCARAEQLQLEEFARLDFSHVNLFEETKEKSKNARKGSKHGKAKKGDNNLGEALELIAGNKGSRIWTTTTTNLSRTTARAAQHNAHAKEETNAVAADAAFIQFHISSVRIEPAAEVRICLQAHNAMAKPVEFQIEIHLHPVDGEVIGTDCLAVITQTECLLNTSETPICIRINLSKQIKKQQQQSSGHVKEQSSTNASANNNVMLVATLLGKIVPPTTI